MFYKYSNICLSIFSFSFHAPSTRYFFKPRHSQNALLTTTSKASMSTSNQHPITPNPLTHSNLISKHTQNSIPTRYNSNYSNHSIREQREPASTHTQSPDTLKLDLQAHSEFNTHTLQQQPQYPQHP